MTITEFLTARLDEDERRAPMYREITGWLAAMFGPVDASMKEVQPGMAAQIALARTADRIDADIAAKRAIAALHEPVDEEPDGWCNLCDGDGWPCATMALLAQPYANHPDYDESWKS